MGFWVIEPMVEIRCWQFPKESEQSPCMALWYVERNETQKVL